MACNIKQVRTALFQEVQNITDITHEKIKRSDRYPLNRIPEGPAKERNANLDSIRVRNAMPARIGYRSVDNTPRPLINGTMPAANLEQRTTLFDTDINDLGENNCHGRCLVDFAQGYERIPGRARELSVQTREFCAKDFDQFNRPMLREWFQNFRDQFSRWGYDNFSDNLLNDAMLFAESNMSILGPNQANFTKGGWEAPPSSFVTIHHLLKFRQHMIIQRRAAGIETPEDWKLEIEMPWQDTRDAIAEYQVRRNSYTTSGVNGVPLAQIPIEPLRDPADGIRGRSYFDFAGIRFYDTIEPIKGIFIRTAASGTPQWKFVRILPYKNVEGGEAGVVQVPNDDYYKDQITIDGVRYRLNVVIPYIDQRAFKRFPRLKPLRPGENNDSVNYDVRMVDGPYIPCNEHNDKWMYVARHEYVFRSDKPELAGFIIYQAAVTPGYVVERPLVDEVGPGAVNVVPDEFEYCGPDACTIAHCATCGEVPDDDHQCVPSGSLPVETLALIPAGPVQTVFDGTAYSLRIGVKRSGSIMSAAGVSYATADGTAEAGDNYTATSGTLAWAAGDNDVKYITVPIIENTSGGPLTFTLTISSPTGATIKAGANVATVSILDGVS